MNHIITIGAFLFLPLCAVAQINRPASSAPKTSPAPSTAATRSAESAPSGDGPLAVKQANGIDIKLLRVEGNAADQQVTLTWILENPKANTDVAFNQAYAVDNEGDEYKDNNGYESQMVLFTDVPKKGGRALASVPSKIDMFRLFKFNMWTRATGQWTVVEFRNLKINWK